MARRALSTKPLEPLAVSAVPESSIPVPAPFRIATGGIVLHLRVTPRAHADLIEGIDIRDDGVAVLRLRVRAAPDKGRANAAVLALLVTLLDVPRSALTLVTGETARLKTVRVVGDPSALAARIASLSAG